MNSESEYYSSGISIVNSIIFSSDYEEEEELKKKEKEEMKESKSFISLDKEKNNDISFYLKKNNLEEVNTVKNIETYCLTKRIIEKNTKRKDRYVNRKKYILKKIYSHLEFIFNDKLLSNNYINTFISTKINLDDYLYGLDLFQDCYIHIKIYKLKKYNDMLHKYIKKPIIIKFNKKNKEQRKINLTNNIFYSKHYKVLDEYDSDND